MEVSRRSFSAEAGASIVQTYGPLQSPLERGREMPTHALPHGRFLLR